MSSPALAVLAFLTTHRRIRSTSTAQRISTRFVALATILSPPPRGLTADFTDPNFYAELAETLLGAVDRIVIADRGIDPGKALTLKV